MSEPIFKFAKDEVKYIVEGHGVRVDLEELDTAGNERGPKMLDDIVAQLEPKGFTREEICADLGKCLQIYWLRNED